MTELFSYFSTIPTLHKLMWLVFCLSLAVLSESITPLRKKNYSWWSHFRTNGSLLASTMIINSIFTALVLMVCVITAENNFGLLAILTLPKWLEFLIALAVLDFFAQFAIHYFLHKIPFLWRFHKVHHSDTMVDATTGTRHHPIDYLTRELLTITVVIALGMPPEYYAMYRIITVFCTYFTHANIQLNPHVDKALNYIIVTPKAHKFHHHHEMPWTDSNFGNIFVFWDKLFGTYVYQSTDDIVYGVDTMDAEKSNSLMHQLTVPFK